MAVPTDSRLGPGTLTFGTGPGLEVGKQIANVMLEPSIDSEDGTPTLGNPDPAPEQTESWVLSGEAIQDWEDPDGFCCWCMDNALTEKAFTWEPNTDAETSFAGTALITSIPIGGDVSSQITSEFEFAVVGVPVRTDPAAAPAASTRDVSRARKARRDASTAKGKKKPATVTT